MSDGGRDPDPWRPLLGEPTDADFENAYDGDAELDATIRARRRRRRIAVITAGGALTFAIGGSLVLPAGDADAPDDPPVPTDAPPAPPPVSMTIELPPTLADAAEPFEIVTVTPSELNRIAVPSGDVTTRPLGDDQRFRTGSFSVAASPAMAAVRTANDSVVLVPNSDAPLVEWSADAFGASATDRSLFVDGPVPGEDERFVVAVVNQSEPDPGEDDVDASEAVLPEIDRFVVDARLAAPIERILTGLPPDAAFVGGTGWWWSEDRDARTVTVGDRASVREVIDGRVVGAGSTSIVVQSCSAGCVLTTYTFDGAEPAELRTAQSGDIPAVFVEAVPASRGVLGLVSDDASLLLDPVAGVVDLTDGSSTDVGRLAGPVAWVPGTTDVLTLGRDGDGLDLIDLRTGDSFDLGAELGRPLAIATVDLD